MCISNAEWCSDGVGRLEQLVIVDVALSWTLREVVR
jgi:hypothetical protein